MENDEDRDRRISHETSRGVRAQAILEDELFKEAVQGTRDHYVSLFTSSDLDDDRSRYHARAGLYALEEVLTHLVSVMQTGRASETEKWQMDERRRIQDAEPGEYPWQ